MTIKTGIELEPWKAPNFARHKRHDEAETTLGIPVSELEPETLDAMAKQWLNHLYASVERPNPFELLSTPSAPPQGDG